MKKYSQGPVGNDQRSMTDCFCCVILVVFILGLFGLAIFAWTHGNFKRLNTPYDSDGKGCGVDYQNYPFIYFASPHLDSLWVTVCVRNCPKQGDKRLDCQPNSKVGCQQVNSADNQKKVQIYDTFALKDVCMPSEIKMQQQISQGLTSQSIISKIAAIKYSWQVLLMAIPISIVLSLIFMCIMRLMAGVVVYLLFVICIASLMVFGVYLLVTNNFSGIGGIQVNRTLTIVLGSIFVVLAVLILFFFICYRTRIKLAATITRVAADFVNYNWSLALVPAVLFFIIIAFLILWIFQAFGYYSMGELVYQEKSFPYQHFQTTTFTKIVAVVHLFQLFWVMFFFIESNDFLVAGTAVSWYFKHQHPFQQSRQRFFKFHFGCVAIGSFLMALLGLIKFVYQLLKPKEDFQPQSCMYYCSKLCSCCCLLCATYLFNWFNNGAYIFIHISGESYCNSAFQVISLRVKNPVATSIINLMQVLYSILVKLGITAATCGFCYIILIKVDPYRKQVHDSTFPIILIGIISFVISSLFVTLYSQGMQTIYISYLVHTEAGGSNENAPSELKQLISDAKRQNHFIQ